MSVPDYRSSYLTTGLIAYIGNKRSLLPFLGESFARCAATLDPSRIPSFLDPFAGSGSVSRLARSMGFSVAAGDIEYYAALIGRCRIACDPAGLEAAFAPEGGAVRAFSALDAFASGMEPASAADMLPPGECRDAWLRAFSGAAAARPYIARHYAPRVTERADWRSERLFYTAENARYLDRAREAVELRYPLDPLEDEGNPDGAAKAALVDALLYGAATHTNTSGVFKACHRGFGGHGGDALGRILAPIRVTPPDLIFGAPGRSLRMDAAACCASRGADIVYLDPPYNQHQYGSNYHLLTTIARWDKPPVPEDRDGQGYLLNRSGIRPNWTETRSDFCSRLRVRDAFDSLLSAVDARFVLLSYNDGGILPQDDLAELLARHGDLRVEVMPYTAYRGGRQSAGRVERTSEFLFVLDRLGAKRRASDSGAHAAGILEDLSRRRLIARIDDLCGRRFHPGRSAARLNPSEITLGFDCRARRGPLLAQTRLEALPLKDLEATAERLEYSACAGYGESLDLLLAVLEQLPPEDARGPALAEEAASLLGKLAFRKYGDTYRRHAGRLRAVLLGSPHRFRRGLAKHRRLENIALKRGLSAGGGDYPGVSSENTSAVKV